jgi:glycosyltransferase involved in cell wall biosynthesis
MMLYRLLKGVSPDDYCLITLEDEKGDYQGSYSRKLPGKYVYLPNEFEFRRGYRFGLAEVRRVVNIFVTLLLNIAVRAVRIARVVRREGCGAVVGCSGGPDFAYLPASFLASRLAGVPFYVYLFDDYATQWTSGLVRLIARRLEPLMMKRADGIVAHSEFLREDLIQRYGVESIVIHNPCDLSDYETALETEAGGRNGEVRIVFTGSLSEGQFGALLNLVKAIELLGRTDLKLHLYTAQSPDFWGEQGLRGPVSYHGDQSAFAMPRVQRQADLLFLPLAFDTPYPALIKTAAPAKTGEYLASRRPILVHAPPDSFLAWYFRRHECGLVVDEDDPAKLAEALERILSDDALAQRLAANARRRALTDFSTQAARAKFAEMLRLELPADPV